MTEVIYSDWFYTRQDFYNILDWIAENVRGLVYAGGVEFGPRDFTANTRARLDETYSDEDFTRGTCVNVAFETQEDAALFKTFWC